MSDIYARQLEALRPRSLDRHLHEVRNSEGPVVDIDGKRLPRTRERVPWIIGDEQATLGAARSLQDEGFFVPAVRYPTVAKGSARLRITVSAAHHEAQVRSLASAIKQIAKKKLR